jgi:AcrR family transcriptional regulator
MAKVLVNAKRAIFTAAKELLDSRGYAALSMREVAGRSGVALGTIYNYYANKQELVQDMMIVQWIVFSERQAAIASSQLGVYVRLYKLYKELGAFVGTFRQLWSMREACDLPKEPDKLTEYLERVADCVEGILLQEARRGGIRLKRDAHELARFIVMNHMALIQMPVFRYELFEGFLKEILGGS